MDIKPRPIIAIAPGSNFDMTVQKLKQLFKNLYLILLSALYCINSEMFSCIFEKILTFLQLSGRSGCPRYEEESPAQFFFLYSIYFNSNGFSTSDISTLFNVLSIKKYVNFERLFNEKSNSLIDFN